MGPFITVYYDSGGFYTGCLEVGRASCCVAVDKSLHDL